MEFQTLLLEAGNDLKKAEVKALVFLCTDLLRGATSASVDTASDLFKILADLDHLSSEKPHLLTELLLIIHQNRLISKLKLPAPLKCLISPFRKLLYELSVELTNKNLEDIKFLLYGDPKFPRGKLDQTQSILEVFLEMEQKDRLSRTNLKLLEYIIKNVCPVLQGKITKFKEDRVDLHISVPEEMPAAASNSHCMEQSQVSHFSNLQGSDFSETRNAGQAFVNTKESMNGNDQALKPYRMTAKKRGICLIINNNDFKNSQKELDTREGTEIDEDSLKKVFRWLNFEVNVRNDCDREQILSLIQELKDTDHSQMDCLVCFVLSHGEEGSVYGVDGLTVKFEELMEPLNGVGCSSLAGKPKLFFIQACQGSNVQKPVYLQIDGTGDSNLTHDSARIISIASDSDFLLAVSSIPSYVSHRHTKKGTWYIQFLCQNLITMLPRKSDLLEILTKVNNDVSRESGSTGRSKQIPRFDSRLREKVLFPFPNDPPPTL
ncbi:caspase-8 isoform X1 [Corythoichthys intestinalis]|uniref:caspase-8 isoform X1 n=1 Tax=Corythoichthys intestinalis TaxID=161448 RepID=UPI0025A60F74|nr:caspase-8 isoform X1 [Corythoichthys intestinalis]XP_057709265.1 caspase-8 isoform X1 [Corythoichthys intestinalis]